MNEHTNGFDQRVPTDLSEIDGRLSEVGSTDRGAALHGLEARIFESTRHLLPRRTVTAHRMDPWVIRVLRITQLRVAAGLALAGTVGALWLANAGTRTVPMVAGSFASDIESLLVTQGDSSDLGTEIDLLFADFASFGERLDQPSLPDAESFGGAM